MVESNLTNVFKCGFHANNVSSKLHTLYKEKELLDITIVAGIDRVAVDAHRVVLSASSDYIRAMFRSSFKEAKSESIELSEVDGETLKAVVDFMYSASIELHSETVENVIKIANLLQMSTLIAGCCKFMAGQLDHTNCIGIAEFAEQHKFADLHRWSLLYVFKNFEKVFKEVEFRKLDVSQLTKLFADDLHQIPDETLFLGIIAWLEHDETSRGQFVYRLLSEFINFKSLDPKFIISNRNSICKISECSELIYSWLEWHLADEERKDKIINTFCKEGALVVHTYCPHCNKWMLEDWPQPKQMRISYSSLFTNKKFIIAGGTIEGVATNTVECLDTQTMEWSNLPSMKVARKLCALAELNGVLYVIGGYDETGEVVRTVEKYNFLKNWENVAEMPSKVDYPKAVALSGKLYVLGANELRLLCYHPATNCWTATKSRIQKSSWFGMVPLKGRLYVIGGKQNNGERSEIVEQYNPLSNTWTWTVLKSTIKNPKYVACYALNHRILVFGGSKKGSTFLKTVIEYDCRTRMWSTLPDCAVVNEKL